MSSPIDRTEMECTVQLLKIFSFWYVKNQYAWKDYSITFGEWKVGGYCWAVRYYPYHSCLNKDWTAFRLELVSKISEDEVRGTLSCQLVDDSGIVPRFGGQRVAYRYTNLNDLGPPLMLALNEEMQKFDYQKKLYFTVECTICVHRVRGEEASNNPLSSPSPDLHQQLGELLQSQKGADVTFLVSGEPIMAHKVVLAARSPIFMAEFFGSMKESGSSHVEIKDIEPAAFRAMLHFIYTDTCTELTEQHARDMGREAVTAMAQHLLEAADRYGLDRLKRICEDRLYRDVDVDMVATTLALADQHGCSRLKKRCIEFIVASAANLDAVMATEGYKDLMASCLFPTSDLLRAAVSRR